MFTQLKQKIFYTILSLSTIFIIMVSALSMYFISDYMLNDYRQTSKDMIQLSLTNLQFDLEIVKSSAMDLSDDEQIKQYVTSELTQHPIIDKISGLSNDFDSVFGTTLYRLNDQQPISSYGVANPPLLSELQSISEIKTFMESDEIILFNIRSTAIAQFYNSTLYPESYGIMSYFFKIYNDSQETIGYLVVDLNPENIYQQYFTYENYPLFANATALIQLSNQEYLKYAENQNMEQFIGDIPLGELTFYDFNHYTYRTLFSEVYLITIVIPSFNLFSSILWIALLFLTFDVLLIIITKIVAKKMAQYVAIPLEKLLYKMKHEQFMRKD